MNRGGAAKGQRRSIGRKRLFATIFAIAGLTAAIATAAPGALDPSFGGDGTVTKQFGEGIDAARAVVVAPDGRIIAAGDNETASSVDFAVARYTPQGKLDPTFSGGSVTIGFANSPNSTPDPYGATGVALAPGGKIIVVGQANALDFGVARLNKNGSLDRSFSGDGKAIFDIGSVDVARDVALAPNGKIYVGGYTGDADFAVMRLNPNGTPDPSFSGGAVSTDLTGRRDFGLGLALDPQGGLYAVGLSSNGQNFDAAVVRYSENGLPDGSFGGGDGAVTFGGAGFQNAHDAQVDSAGRLLLAGEARPGGFLVSRLLRSGSFDTTFGQGGATLVGFGSVEASAREVAIAPDGSIVVGGDANRDAFALARLGRNGRLDPSFSADGRTTTDIGGYEGGRALDLQPDGRIVMAGVAQTGGGTAWALARYRVSSTPVRCAGQAATISSSARTITGTPGPDVIAAGAGRQVISSLGGADFVCTGRGNDVIRGGAGRDRLAGGAGRDRLAGSAGKDRLLGSVGKDRLAGGLGPDALSGGSGRDRLIGGAGRDKCRGGAGRDSAAGCERTSRVP